MSCSPLFRLAGDIVTFFVMTVMEEGSPLYEHSGICYTFIEWYRNLEAFFRRW